MFCLIFFGCIILFWLLQAIFDHIKKGIEKKVVKEKQIEFDAISQDLISQQKSFEAYKKQNIDAINILAAEKSKGFPFLASAYADFIDLKYTQIEKYFKYKPKPALKSAEIVNELKKETKSLAKENKILKYTIDYYENLYPSLTDYKDISDDDIREIFNNNNDEKDPLLKWLSPEEYKNLPISEKNQLALDRYKKSHKSKYQIGKEYERYIGYLFEKEGYDVEYYGALKGLNDLGIDLICKKSGCTSIIQCKRWSKDKLIHEKHINQLFGTSVTYAIQNGLLNNNTNLKTLDQIKIYPWIYTTTELSDTAKTFSTILNVKYKELFPFRDYPRIKCNINNTGKKIYHMPFDQQYDRVKLVNKGEFYATTVKEAELKGFRRANRWVEK